MAIAHAERQRRYRERTKLLDASKRFASRYVTRDELLPIVMGLKEEIAVLRDAVRDVGTKSHGVTRDILLTPSLKNPSDKDSYKEKKRVEVRKNGARLPEAWEPSSEDREFAVAWGLDPDLTADIFRNYWLPKTGRNATKLDWSRTWRNWCMNEKHAKRPNGHANGHAIPQFGAVQLAEIEDHKRRIRESLGDREDAKPKL